MINALRDIQMKYEGIGGGSSCFWVAWALVLALRTSVGFGPLALKGKDIAAEKMAVGRLQPAKQ